MKEVKKRPRDFQRDKVYKATHALPHGQHFETIAEVKVYLDNIVALDWLQDLYGRTHAGYAMPEITLRDGRGRRKAGAGWDWQDQYFISLPRWARYEAMILHELAHILAPRQAAWHGEEFVGIFLALVDHIMDVDATEVFRQHDVKWQGVQI